MHAAVRTRLVPHLLRTQPCSPPSSIVPCIHAAQGPPDCNLEDCKGEDSLERQQVANPCSPPRNKLGKCKHELPSPHPYCLRCHSENPGYESSDCPYDRKWWYCWSAYHRHHECPSPYLTCNTTQCIVPLTHRNLGTVCATSVTSGDDTYEMHVTSGDYDGDLEGFTTD